MQIYTRQKFSGVDFTEKKDFREKITIYSEKSSFTRDSRKSNLIFSFVDSTFVLLGIPS